MGNRPKIKNHLRLVPDLVDIPAEEKVVVKTVPANIYWCKVDPTRTDVEHVGEMIFYEDGSYDLIISNDISDEARDLMSTEMSHSLQEE